MPTTKILGFMKTRSNVANELNLEKNIVGGLCP